MTLEDDTRYLVASSERLIETAEGVRRWAEGYLPGVLPRPLQALIDAATEYRDLCDRYQGLPVTEPPTRKEDPLPG